MLSAPDIMFAVPSGQGSIDWLLELPGQLWIKRCSMVLDNVM